MLVKQIGEMNMMLRDKVCSICGKPFPVFISEIIDRGKEPIVSGKHPLAFAHSTCWRVKKLGTGND